MDEVLKVVAEAICREWLIKAGADLVADMPEFDAARVAAAVEASIAKHVVAFHSEARAALAAIEAKGYAVVPQTSLDGWAGQVTGIAEAFLTDVTHAHAAKELAKAIRENRP